MCRQRLLDALMSTPAGRRRLEAYEDKIDLAIADRGPDFDLETGRQGTSEAAAEAAGAAPTTVEHEQPRRTVVPSPVADDVRQAPASREPVRLHTAEIPSKFRERRPPDDDAQKEMEEEPEDTEI